MILENYYRDVLVPANNAVSLMRQAGIPVDPVRATATLTKWAAEIDDLERDLSGDALERGVVLTFSERHQAPADALQNYLYRGLRLRPAKLTPVTMQPSTSEDALKEYASLSHPRDSDVPQVRKLLRLRALAKCSATYLESFLRERRSDGAVHPTFHWSVVRTARISASNPPVHQLPERKNPDLVQGVKACLVPRSKPAPSVAEWNPRLHGSCFKWDIASAEMAVRAAMLTHRYCTTRPLTLWDYIVNAKDPHALTASFLYDVPEGTYGKGTDERDIVAKMTNFLLIYGGGANALRANLRLKARMDISEEQAIRFVAQWFQGYPEITELLELDKAWLGKRGYAVDGYGRRRHVPIPTGARFLGYSGGTARWSCPREVRGDLEAAFHTAANTPTQSMNASDAFWMLNLCAFGEYTPLRTPECWSDKGGVLFPGMKRFGFHENSDDGLRPLRAWQTNCVHDSAWGDCAEGELERTVLTAYRRCTAVPFDWRLKANVPYRIDIYAGPDHGNLRPWNDVADEFGYERTPKR